jgi:hypothetical protein
MRCDVSPRLIFTSISHLDFFRCVQRGIFRRGLDGDVIYLMVLGMNVLSGVVTMELQFTCGNT